MKAYDCTKSEILTNILQEFSLDLKQRYIIFKIFSEHLFYRKSFSSNCLWIKHKGIM